MKIVKYEMKPLPLIEENKEILDFNCFDGKEELNAAILKEVKENEIKQRKSQIAASEIYSD